MKDMKTEKKICEVGENIKTDNAAWSFTGDVPENFNGHVRRSVPFYGEGHDLILKLSDFFVKNDSVCYDVGTSVGQLLIQLCHHNCHKENVKWVGIDAEEGMIQKARENTEGLGNISLEVARVEHYDFEKSDFIISNYTIQFIHPKFRQQVIDNIYNSLNWGGGFVLFEKVRAPDARFQDMMRSLYTDYKLDKGYSPSEIVAKERSLKGILEPFSTQGNVDLLKRAGFSDIMTVMKYVCFEGFLAIK